MCGCRPAAGFIFRSLLNHPPLEGGKGAGSRSVALAGGASSTASSASSRSHSSDTIVAPRGARVHACPAAAFDSRMRDGVQHRKVARLCIVLRKSRTLHA